MRRSLANPPQFALVREDGGHLVLRETLGAVAHIFVLEGDIFRIAVLPDGAWKGPATWAIAPGQSDVPSQGRPREDVGGFTCPPYTLAERDGALTIETARLRLTVKLSGFFCRWEMRRGDAWVRIARDRQTQAYDFGWWD